MKPKKTLDWLVDAQQNAIDFYNSQKYIYETDVYKILELNPYLADDGNALVNAGQNLTDGDICRIVSRIARNYYDIVTPVISKNHHDPELNDLTSITCPTVQLKKEGNMITDFLIHNGYISDPNEYEEKNKMRDNNRLKGIAIDVDLAEEELAQLVLQNGYFTPKEMYRALGINKGGNDSLHYCETYNRYEENYDLKKRIHGIVERALDSVYLFDSDFDYAKLTPRRMWTTSNGYTTVEWSDGTKTTVKIEDEANATKYGGFCACVVKKLFGGTSNAIGFMNRAEEYAKWPSKMKEIERRRIKEIKKAKADQRVKEARERKERMVREQMELIKAREEAYRIIQKEEKNDD